MGGSAFVADRLAMHGNTVGAAQLFPWNRYIRTRPGYDVLARGGSINTLEAALASDPYSADLTYGLGFIYLATGQTAKAEALAQRFIALTPNSPITKKVTQK
jgi:hypothetical protein